ncbi:MAG: hypothetical protein II849_07850 [Bacteroidales bacterium]|nr:hypothetical protein [Bacteroidales bacterium]
MWVKHVTIITIRNGILTMHRGKRKQAQQQKADFLRHLFHIQSVLLFVAKWIMLQIYKIFSIQGEKKTTPAEEKTPPRASACRTPPRHLPNSALLI